MVKQFRDADWADYRMTQFRKVGSSLKSVLRAVGLYRYAPNGGRRLDGLSDDAVQKSGFFPASESTLESFRPQGEILPIVLKEFSRASLIRNDYPIICLPAFHTCATKLPPNSYASAR